MTTYNLDKATAIKYASRDITKVYLGSVMIWPIHHIVEYTFDNAAHGAELTKLITEAENDGAVYDPLIEINVPHETTHFNIAPLKEVSDLNPFMAGNMYVSSLRDTLGNFYGHNKNQGATEGSVIGGSRAFQTRYGGTWIFPGTAKPGDVAYVTVGDDYAEGMSVIKITFT